MKTKTFYFFSAIIAISILSTQMAFSQNLNWRTAGNANCAGCILGTLAGGGDLDFYTEGTQKATLTTTGSLGIGTTGPSVKLHVLGGTDTELGSGGFLVLGSTGGLNVSFDDNEIEARDAGAATTLSIQNDGGDLNISNGGLIVTGSTNNVTIGGTLDVAGATVSFGSVESISDGGLNIIELNSNVNPSSNLFWDVGTSNSIAWDDMRADNFFNVSDIKEKENIKAIGYGLDAIMRLNPVTFTMKRKPEAGNKIGFIAQDMFKVIPEVVNTTNWERDEQGNLTEVKLDTWAIDYGKVTAVLVKAIQEQQGQIETKDVKIAALEDRINKLEAAVNSMGTIEKSGEISPVNFAMLEQNAPNPFRETTTIRYRLPEDAPNAIISITNAEGKIIKTVSADQSGSVIIHGREFNAGVYNYSLIINGIVADTKMMVLTK